MIQLVALTLSLLTVSLQAQQSIQLPPRTVTGPVIVEQTPIPQQSSSELQGMATEPSLERKSVDDSSFTEFAPKSIDDSGSPARDGTLSKAAEIARLTKLASYNLQTNKAPLAEVIMLLADACQMSYAGLEKGIAENIQISVNISKNPYETMKYICDRYNVSMDYDQGVWRFAVFNDDELIARIYHVRYNDQSETSGGSGGSSGSSSSSSGSSSGSSSSGSLGGSSGGSGGLGSASAFTLKNDVILKDVQTFLDLSSQNPTIATAEDFDVEHLTSVTTRGISRLLAKSDSKDASGGKGKVIYNSDNKSLYVLATHAQHQWIEKYLKATDKPLRQILVETKIYQTGMSPDAALGINLTGTRLQKGNNKLTVSSSPGLTPTGSLSAILNLGQLTATLNLLDSDTASTSVHYPRQVTISNRPVTMSSIEKYPVLDTQNTLNTGSSSTGGTTTPSASSNTSVRELEIGTNISILPRIIDENKVQLDIAISVSSLGESAKVFNPDGTSFEYPTTSQRTYNTQAIVENGYTLAIGGLKDTTMKKGYGGVPVLSQIPFAGVLFRNNHNKRTENNLMIFISPSILDSYRGGVKDQPQFIAPRDKDYAARRIFQGSSDESYTDIMLSLAGLEYPMKEYAQRVKEESAPKELLNQIASTRNELKLMQVRLQEIALEQPNKDISDASRKINQYLKDLNELRGIILKHRAEPFI